MDIENVRAFVSDLIEFLFDLDRNIDPNNDFDAQFHIPLREKAERLIAEGDVYVAEWERFQEDLGDDSEGGLAEIAPLQSNEDRYKAQELTRSYEESVRRLERIEDILCDCLEYFDRDT